MKNATRLSRTALLALIALGALTLAGCPSEPAPSPDGGAGAGGTGGRGGSGGSGGAVGTGGVGGSGGSGGRGGSGGGGADAGRMDRPGADGSADRGPDRPGVDGGGTDGGNASGGLDQCFQGLRAGVGRFQLSTKASADGKVRMRIAMEDGGDFGTSGSVSWKPMRLGVEIDGASACITDEPALRAGYKQTQLHNCRDVLTVESGGRRYEIVSPDTRQTNPDGRTVATLTASMGNTVVVGPVMLMTESCVTKVPMQSCLSGGPCTN